MPAATEPRPTCTVLELRQYTLKPGQRDPLIALFEQSFIEPQEATGMTVFGQFRDGDDPDRFVWLRGFADMPARAEALAAFYGGPVWAAHREAANATMVDSDNVLLLRPARPGSGFPLAARPSTAGARSGLVVANLCYFDAPVDADLLARFHTAIVPLLVATGARPIATLVTESAPNNFPRLPVREGEHVLAWFSAFEGLGEYATHMTARATHPGWRAAWSAIHRRLSRSETLRLTPTARSRLPPAGDDR